MSFKFPSKAKDYAVTKEFLDHRVGSGKFGRSKWIQFCDAMLAKGRSVHLTETHGTYSKYITVGGPFDLTYLVRFSDHMPNYRRQANQDCDFFVGKTHFGTWALQDALDAVEEYFNGETKENT